ncbi:hypothetical protein NDA11_006905 [Ustilago hordei]|uniref:Uncharacterized protein n=1 Tax=Ustilago hordei TaxID=120017 RepID=I2G1Z2_USTHO|nr:uncharacterized protein UHO2_02376 [Ustilago hordei]KAJ1040027.1 hypothetical protein NDA10_002018 [Ustilago hordei]KAJ1585423.1 hypothetical protein NDA15_006080 [Ustilago hordei]KAJ1587914.1 hypothetical protein NDA12_001881 [Ustilago hordei]KAJ1593293.1 hypothetical protein NDA11_006905 [Ustilago hordei]KAJ1601681.1 hypothetical protein NDA14_005244 [Ustilago hordei]
MLDRLAFTLIITAVGAVAQATLTDATATVMGIRFIAAVSPSGTPDGILKYIPSPGGNYFVGGLYAVYAAVLFYYIFRHKDQWALCLPFGCFFSAIGYFVRPSIDPYNVSLGLYIIQSMFVVISPAAFLAFNYLLYGRMILAVDKEFGSSGMDLQAMESQPLTAAEKITMLHKAGGSKREKSRYSFIPPRIVGRVFVWSDVATFLVQVSAGGMQASGGAENPGLTEIGDKLFLVGVILQGVSYILFTLLLTYATILVMREGARNNVGQMGDRKIMGLDKPVFALVGGLYFSSIFVIIRSFYRIIEFSQGYSGYLVSQEIYLFVLDAAPLLLAVGIWVTMWPSALLEKIFEKRFSGEGAYSLQKTST